MEKFQTGKAYSTFILSGKKKYLEVTWRTKNSVTGIIDGKEKKFDIVNYWNCLADKQEGKQPIGEKILLDKRYGTFLLAEDEVKEKPLTELGKEIANFLKM